MQKQTISELCTDFLHFIKCKKYVSYNMSCQLINYLRSAMKQLLSIFLLSALMITFANAEGEKKYGKEISLTETTKISTIMENPESFIGQKVLVEGTVVGVCSKRGCWIELASDEAHQKIKVKVEDGVIVFPMEALGKKAIVEGELFALAPIEDHHEEEKESCATTEACSHEKQEVKKVYQIKGLGAVIQ